LSLKVGELYGELGLDDGPFNKTLKGAGGALGGLTKIAAAVAVAAGAALAGIAVKGIMAFTEFERGMNEVFTLLPGITQPAMDSMTQQVKDFSTEFGILPEEVIPALYQSISAGIPQENLFDFMTVAAKTAVGGATDLETAVDGISSTINAYGKDTLSAASASEIMFTAVRLGKTTIEELSNSLFNVNPIAAALGIKFEEVAAALATMTAQGVPTSVATTEMRQMFVELSQAGGELDETFQEVAGKSFKDFIAGGGNVQEALQLLEKHAAETGVGVNDLFGSVEAGSAALTLTGKGTDTFTNNIKEMGEAAGATDQAFEQMKKGVGFQIDQIKAKLQVALINIGDWLLPYVTAAMADLETEFDKLPAWWEAHKEEIKSAMEDVGGAMKTLAEVAKAAFTIVTENWNTFKVAIMVGAPVIIGYLTALKVSALLTAVGLGVMAGTAGLVVGAIASLVVSVVLLWTQWENLKQAVMNNAWIQVIVGWLAIFAFAFNPVIFAAGVARAAVDLFSDGVAAVPGKINAALDSMMRSPVAAALFGTAMYIAAAAAYALGWALDLVDSKLDSVKSKLATIASGAFSMIPGVSLPGFASGVTNFAGGWAIVGERGPELLNLPRGSNVIPNDQMMSGASHIQNTTNTFQITINAKDGTDAADKFMRRIEGRVRLNG
jgi:TP901 family phage tail tape measure protein